MRSSSQNCGALIDVRFNISLLKFVHYSQVRKTFSFDRSHKFEEIFFAIDCIWTYHVSDISCFIIFFKKFCKLLLS